MITLKLNCISHIKFVTVVLGQKRVILPFIMKKELIIRRAKKLPRTDKMSVMLCCFNQNNCSGFCASDDA